MATLAGLDLDAVPPAPASQQQRHDSRPTKMRKRRKSIDVISIGPIEPQLTEHSPHLAGVPRPRRRLCCCGAPEINERCYLRIHCNSLSPMVNYRVVPIEAHTVVKDLIILLLNIQGLSPDTFRDYALVFTRFNRKGSTAILNEQLELDASPLLSNLHMEHGRLELICLREPSLPPSAASLLDIELNLDPLLRESFDVGAEHRDQVGPPMRLKYFTPKFEIPPVWVEELPDAPPSTTDLFSDAGQLPTITQCQHMLPDDDLPPIGNVAFMTKRVCVLGALPFELEGAQVVPTRPLGASDTAPHVDGVFVRTDNIHESVLFLPDSSCTFLTDDQQVPGTCVIPRSATIETSTGSLRVVVPNQPGDDDQTAENSVFVISGVDPPPERPDYSDSKLDWELWCERLQAWAETALASLTDQSMMLVSRENTLNASAILADIDNESADNADDQVDEDKTPEPLPSMDAELASSDDSDNAWSYHEDIGNDHFRPSSSFESIRGSQESLVLALSAEEHRRTRCKWEMLSYKALMEYMGEVDLRPYKRIPDDVDIDLPDLVLKWHRMIGVIMAVEKSRARDVFRLMDGDKDGKLRRKEVYATARHFELGFNPYEVNALFDYLDVNGDNRIDLGEFCRHVRVVHVTSDFSPRSGRNTSNRLLDDTVNTEGPSPFDSRRSSMVTSWRSSTRSSSAMSTRSLTPSSLKTEDSPRSRAGSLSRIPRVLSPAIEGSRVRAASLNYGANGKPVRGNRLSNTMPSLGTRIPMAPGSSLRSRLSSTASSMTGSQATAEALLEISDGSEGTITPEMSDFEDADAVLQLLEEGARQKAVVDVPTRDTQFTFATWIWPAAKNAAEMAMTSAV
eukprot:m.126652 g.126652  ORF g.126652 m.126652 type:complete len:852 (+) comp15777_c0_seq1:115-2670(+)